MMNGGDGLKGLDAERPDLQPGARGDETWALILAGGAGKRLQRFAREILGTERPKQFCRIIGTRSMLRHTWDRAARLVDPDRIVTIITAGQERYLDEEARRGVPGTVLVQPANKDTGPGLLLPLLWIDRRAPEATVAVFPADHFIWEEDRFVAHLRAGVAAAETFPDRLAVLGVEADSPDVSYGWIAPGEPLGVRLEAEVYAVRRFWEKPGRRTAARLFAAGHLWNTLVLAGRLQTYLGLAEEYLPEVLEPLRAVEECLGTTAQTAALREAYRCMASTNFSQGLLAQRPERLMVLAARGVCWSDWGDPDRILRTLRRFDQRPGWLPQYARARAQAAVVFQQASS
jgi:mannose-1-phosphate guanylyltransferase